MSIRNLKWFQVRASEFIGLLLSSLALTAISLWLASTGLNMHIIHSCLLQRYLLVTLFTITLRHFLLSYLMWAVLVYAYKYYKFEAEYSSTRILVTFLFVVAFDLFLKKFLGSFFAC